MTGDSERPQNCHQPDSELKTAPHYLLALRGSATLSSYDLIAILCGAALVRPQPR